MANQTELELKFLVPAETAKLLSAEMARRASGGERSTLSALYLDTEEGLLARAGLSWRLRREGRRWIQTLKSAGPSAHERLEHEVIRPGATWDADAHAGTVAGERLLATLQKAKESGAEIGVRYQTEVRRALRRMRTGGAVVEVAFDQGRLLADESSLRIREVEFELVSGSSAALLALAQRWRKRFNLLYEPRSKSERGDLLARGVGVPQVRKAVRPTYAAKASPTEAFGAVLDECLAQITCNAIGLCIGDHAARVEHVHQMRIGIRRLRSAVRSFDGWVDTPPEPLLHALRQLFAQLGLARDSDVMKSGVAAELYKAGAPPLRLPAGRDASDPSATVRAGSTQQLFLAWIDWRLALFDPPALPEVGVLDMPETTDLPGAGVRRTMLSESVCAAVATTVPKVGLRRLAERRLRRWHQRIIGDWKTFDDLPEAGLHALRKRIKRQRYAVEFFSPLFRRRTLDPYLKALVAVQDCMGQLNDLYVAMAGYQSMVKTDPTAWFALGWITARIQEVQAATKPALGRLAESVPPKG